MPLRIDAKVSHELQAVLVAIKAVPAEVRKEIRQQTKAIGTPQLVEAMSGHAQTRLEHRVLIQSARVTVSDQNVRLSSATVGRSLPGGLQPKDDYAAVEFGANRAKRTSYTARSRKGRSYPVTRRTTQQLRPRRRTGYVFFPAVAALVPRIAALWTQTVVRTIGEALEGRRG